MPTDSIVKSVKLDGDGNPILPVAQALAASKGATKPPAAQAAVAAKFIGGKSTKVFKLEWPIEFEGVEYHELTLRVVTGHDLSKLEELSELYDGNSAMLAIMAGIPPEVAQSLAADDMFEALQEARPFMPRSMRRAIEQLAAQNQTPETSDTPNSETGTTTPP